MPYYKVEIVFDESPEDSALYLTIRAHDGFYATELARELYPTAFSIIAEKFRD